jgi:hypothetical protein
MSDATYIACPRCGEPYAMTPMQKRLYHGRTLACQRCAKPFTVTEQTPDPVPAPAVQPWVEMPAPAFERAARPAAAAAADPDDDDNGEPRRARRRPGEGMTPGRMALLVLGVLAVLMLGAYAAFRPAINRAREASRRAACAANLQQIGMALQFYASQSGGRFPDSLDAVVLDGSISADMLVCPSSNDTVAPGTTPAEQVANLAKGGHQSYVYVGGGLTVTGVRQALAYEPLHHHGGGGINVLYTDGTVQFLPTAAALTAFPQLGGPATMPSIAPPTPTPSASPGTAGANP